MSLRTDSGGHGPGRAATIIGMRRGAEERRRWIDERVREGAGWSRRQWAETRLAGRFTLRVAIGNPRQRPEHVAMCWRLLRESGGAGREG